MPQAKIAPSLLSGDFARLAEECQGMVDCGADMLHMDVMDGHFVPNLTIGAPIIKSLRPHTKAFLDCHLMVSHPQQWIDDFAKAGADGYTFHIEAIDGAGSSNGVDLRQMCQRVKDAGMRCGISIKPKTQLSDKAPGTDRSIIDVLMDLIRSGLLDMILIMTVEPGFGGQKIQIEQLQKVTALREQLNKIAGDVEQALQFDIQVDGGIDLSNIETVARSGANVIVSGTGIFKPKQEGVSSKDAITQMKDIVNSHIRS
ncbi:hypothetical protein MP228_011691 [Amoeboaphelidium protococcarum]|nr:hypothetical protein MP228_011691 [Amoeboaphelidium protococcarum]